MPPNTQARRTAATRGGAPAAQLLLAASRRGDGPGGGRAVQDARLSVTRGQSTEASARCDRFIRAHPPSRRQPFLDVRVDGVEVLLAPRCLLQHGPERSPLELYWDAAKQENEIGRAQGVTAAFNGIVRHLRRAGRYEEVSPPRDP